MAVPGNLSDGPSRWAHAAWIYAKYQLAGMAMTAMSIASMLMADRGFLSREPVLAVIYVVVLAVPAGAWGTAKAVQFLLAGVQPSKEQGLRPG